MHGGETDEQERPLFLHENVCEENMLENLEISRKGIWTTVPAVKINGKYIVVRGNWIKMAIIEAEDYLESEVEDPELCLKQLKVENSDSLHADIFTFSQKIPATRPKYEYPMEWDSAAVVRTTSFKEWWDELPQETRKNVRRSQKRGVVVKVSHLDDELIKGIVGVNNDSPVRSGKRYVHYGKSFDQVRKDQSSFLDRSDFVCAYLKDELIGFIKIIYRGDVAAILQILPKASHHDKRPANALIAKTVEICETKGICYLTYGMFNYGNKGNSPIREFKIRNGFREMLVPRFYVPLTGWGSLCVRLKLHRGLLGILPRHVITTAVGARSFWYDLKLRISRCSSKREQPNRNRQMERSIPPTGSSS